jgi:NADPH-dependent glutamate synthase beta subunit-like oxidoreductase
VAIVGSGPAGLSCAYFLAGMGYPVTVFEAMPVLGGMLRLGIPEYRLPSDVLDEQIGYIRDMGVEFRTGAAVGRDIGFKNLWKDHAAVFWATGNQLSRKIEVEGNDLDGVTWGLDFLRDIKLGKEVKIADSVVVVGGGNVAVDVALSARKMGAREVRLVCLETGDEIPAYPEEIRQAVAEGIEILEGWGPQKISGNGRGVNGIQLVKCTRVYDTDGRFAPQYDTGNTQNLETSAVVLAVGQAADHTLSPDGMELTADGRVKVDTVSLETSLTGLFAGGDIVSGSSSVVQAIADGKKAAFSLDLYLRGEDVCKGQDNEPSKVANPPGEGIPQAARTDTPQIPAAEAAGDFREIKPGFDEENAYREVQRCMTCGSRSVITYVEECRLCKGCETSCPVQAIYPAPVRRIEPHVKIADNWQEIAGWMGADAGVLEATVEEYNQACEHGRDGLFAKDPMYMVPLRTPPYYAIKSNSDYLDTIGGIKVNERLEVLNRQDQPIKGLYAAGVIAGGWQHDTYCVVLSGAASGFAINSGRMAAENAIKTPGDNNNEPRL